MRIGTARGRLQPRLKEEKEAKEVELLRSFEPERDHAKKPNSYLLGPKTSTTKLTFLHFLHSLFYFLIGKQLSEYVRLAHSLLNEIKKTMVPSQTGQQKLFFTHEQAKLFFLSSLIFINTSKRQHKIAKAGVPKNTCIALASVYASP